ncbi:hypothetical protein GTA08_BOTSDO05497 [Neofusicoccum parvum]|uniref:Uncharacterized protein n=1 Tax=Neofusicoccum parvum TaxID=310453 RepID=A0ACB5RRD2_9PEZI|nr:hypothetical protein GTA08_BOTSDO05497 [Neofusicoccum parvum]
MAYTKRSRAAFEADLAQLESPYAVVGTPLPPLDDNTRDDGSYVPLWKQEATDERGRKRFHGAFTGGYSAGYFNTVGSKEGWTPSTFVSSRANRRKDQKNAQQRPEDFMDDEDLAAQAEAQKLQTASAFSALGSTGDDVSRRDVLMGMVKTAGETMGAKLLQKMGWKPGQGVGPKIRRRARLDPDEEGDADQQMHLFAPENSRMITFVRKNDHKGLGYEGEARLSGGARSSNDPKDGEDSDEGSGAGPLGTLRKPNVKKPAKRSGFGVGVLNDDGSDEEDPYEIGPKISYSRTIGGDKKPKKKKDTIKAAGSSANPLVGAKPVFISKKAIGKKSEGFRKCHDGRLPLEGFILATQALTISDGGAYAPPAIPEGWKSSKKTPEEHKQDAAYQSILQFYPTRLVCKRFNIKPPEHVQPDADNAPGDAASTAAPARDLTVVSQSAIQEMMRESASRQPYSSAPADGARAAEVPLTAAPVHAHVDVERNEALEAEKAGDAVFKAIFGSDDEDE